MANAGLDPNAPVSKSTSSKREPYDEHLMRHALLQSRLIDAATIFIIQYSLFVIHFLPYARPLVVFPAESARESPESITPAIDHNAHYIDGYHNGTVTLLTTMIHASSDFDQMRS